MHHSFYKTELFTIIKNTIIQTFECINIDIVNLLNVNFHNRNV